MKYLYTIVVLFLNCIISWGRENLPQDLDIRYSVLKCQLNRIEKVDSLLFENLPETFEEYYELYGSEEKPLSGYPNIIDYLNSSETAQGITQKIIGIATTAIPGKHYDPCLQNVLLSRLYKGGLREIVGYLNRHTYTENVVFWNFLFLREKGLCSKGEMNKAYSWLKDYNAQLRVEEYKYLDAIKEGYYLEPSVAKTSFHVDQKKVSCVKALFAEIEEADRMLLEYLPTSFDEYFALCGFDKDKKDGPLYSNQDIVYRLAKSSSIDRKELIRKVLLLCSGGGLPDTDHIGILQDCGYEFVNGEMAHYCIPILNRMSYDENLSFWRFIFGGIETRIPECERDRIFHNFEQLSKKNAEKYLFMDAIKKGYYLSVDGLYH